MNAKMIGLFSGFPSRQFPAEVARYLKQELTKRTSLVFVSAWPSEYERNDCDAAGMHGMFAAWDMAFRRFCVIDHRTEIAQAGQLIRNADCIFLMGGHATQQFQLICEKQIAEELRRSAAVILGVSAGASNMAKRALDIWESHEPYEGLGLTDLTVKAHITLENDALINTLKQISAAHAMPICGMADDSAIFIKHEGITCIGQIYWIGHSDIQSFRPEMMKQ